MLGNGIKWNKNELNSTYIYIYIYIYILVGQKSI